MNVNVSFIVKVSQHISISTMTNLSLSEQDIEIITRKKLLPRPGMVNVVAVVELGENGYANCDSFVPFS